MKYEISVSIPVKDMTDWEIVTMKANNIDKKHDSGTLMKPLTRDFIWTKKSHATAMNLLYRVYDKFKKRKGSIIKMSITL